MTAVFLSPVGGVAAQFFTNDGVPLAGGFIYTYLAGTSTPAVTYTNAAGSVAHSNPIVLDSAGRVPTGEIWLPDGVSYKFVLKDSTDALLATYDNIVGINSNFVNYTASQEIQTATAGQTLFTLTTMAYQPGTNSLSVFVDGVNQYGPGAQYAFVETSGTSVTFASGLHVGASVKFTTAVINTSSYGNASEIGFTGFKGQAGTVQDLADDDGSDWIGFLPAGTNAVARSAQDKMRDFVNVADFGAPTDGTDATSAINAAILAAYLSKANVATPTDETYCVEIMFEAGKDYTISGTILLPSGIILNGNGCRLVGGQGSASSTAYNASLPSLIETAYYDGSAIVTNKNSSLASNRVVGSGICNFKFINTNCAINAISMNEQCFVEHNSFSNVSAAMRLKWCFYLRVVQNTVRSSSQAVGQSAIHLIGGNHNAMLIQQIALVAPSIGILVNGPASFATVIDSCTFEEGKASNSAGILFGSDAYCGGWQITNNYVEGVRYGFSFDSGASIYGGVIDANIFNNNEYAIICSGPNALRMTSIRGNSLPDDGGTNRNLVEASDANIDVILQIPTKIGKTSTGTVGFLNNFTLGNAGTIEANSVWVNDSALLQAIGKAQPGLANQNKLNAMPFEGANIVTVANQVPFCAYPTINPTTAVMDTQLTYDSSNVLIFNFEIQDFNGTYNLHGMVFGSTVYRNDTATPTVTITNNSGVVRVTFGNINTNSGASFIIEGMIRHA